MENKIDPKNHQSQEECKHSGFKHMGMMLICCLVPLAAAFILKQLGYSGIASYLILLLCPIMHMFIMKDMFTKKEEAQSNLHKQDGPGGIHG